MDEECPICNEKCILKDLGECRLKESKHKVCEECHNKSDNKCWLCGDRIKNNDVRIIEIRENINNQIVIIEHNNRISYKNKLINCMCITLVYILVLFVIIVFAKLIEYLYCIIFKDEECNVTKLSISPWYYIYASMSVLMWIAIIIMGYIYNNRNQT